MMTMNSIHMKVIIQLLSILAFIFPPFIYGLQCDVGGKCYGNGLKTPEPTYTTKTCNGTCVYFNCIFWEDSSSSSAVMEGAGCYEDFVNVCKWIPTKYKDQIKAHKTEIVIFEQPDIVYYGCKDGDRCATDGRISFTPNDIFGSLSGGLQYPERVKCKYDNTQKTFIEKKKCGKKISCRPASNYDKSPSYINGDDRECDACLEFECTNDNGNTVIAGSGCWDDFVHACPTVPDDIKEKLKTNQKDAFYYDKNYVVSSCGYQVKVDRSCYHDYVSSNIWQRQQFEANLKKTYNKNCSAELFHPPQIQTTTSASPFYFSFKFYEIIITVFGLTFIYLW